MQVIETLLPYDISCAALKQVIFCLILSLYKLIKNKCRKPDYEQNSV